MDFVNVSSNQQPIVHIAQAGKLAKFARAVLVVTVVQ